MATYDVTSHPKLSYEASQLATSDPTAFDAYALTAEDDLSLTSTTLTGSSAEKAKLAVVRQINLIMSIDTNSLTKAVARRGSVTDEFRSAPSIDPVAKRIVQQLGVFKKEEFKSIRRLR